MHRGVSLTPYRLSSLLRRQESSLRGSPVDCGFKHAAMTTASKTGLANFFCHVALVPSVIILFFCSTVVLVRLQLSTKR